MKKLTTLPLEKINGGAPCIYHGYALGLGILGALWNGGALYECLKNSHK